MAKTLATFEFPHGGRKGMEIDFSEWLDGQIWVLEKGVDWDMETSADTFLGALSSAANAKNLRVNKSVNEAKTEVTIRARPKKEKVEKAEGTENKKQTASAKK
jgi:hypothetical protein